MHRTLLIALATAALCAGAAPVSAAGAKGDQCFLSSDVTNWRAVGDRQVNLEVRNREVYRLDLGTACPQLRFAGQTIALEARGGGHFVCQSSLADVLVPGQGPLRCPVTAITHLTREQAQALPKNQRP